MVVANSGCLREQMPDRNPYAFIGEGWHVRPDVVIERDELLLYKLHHCDCSDDLGDGPDIVNAGTSCWCAMFKIDQPGARREHNLSMNGNRS